MNITKTKSPRYHDWEVDIDGTRLCCCPNERDADLVVSGLKRALAVDEASPLLANVRTILAEAESLMEQGDGVALDRIRQAATEVKGLENSLLIAT